MKLAVVGLVLAAGLTAYLLLRPAAPPAPAPVVREPVRTLPLPAAIADASSDAPVVLWVAQALARFEPCGCVAGMHGGLMRRAPLTARLPAARTLSVELGGWSGGARAHERIRSRYYLRGLAAAGIDAVAIGEAEVRLGREHLAALAGEGALHGLPLVCANLGEAPGVQSAVEVTAGNRRLLVTAVVPDTAAGTGLTVRPAVESLAALAEQAAARNLDLVCLADLASDECLALARAVPQLALVIGGRADHPSPEPVAVGAVRVLWAGNLGKVLGLWAWGQPQAAFELLADSLPECPEQRAILGAYQRALAESDLDTVASGGLRPLGAAGYVGSAACLSCHADAHTVHERSRHAHAFASLERKGYHHDPDCLRCHVTGLGEGGYRRGLSHFAQVGCESCHGPGEHHIRDSSPLAPLSPASCITCHDAENSPHFNYEQYWPKIQH